MLQEAGQKLQGFLRPGLGNPRILLLPHSIGQANHKDQLRFKRNGIRIHLLMGAVAKNMRSSLFYHTILSSDLGKQSPWPGSWASGGPILSKFLKHYFLIFLSPPFGGWHCPTLFLLFRVLSNLPPHTLGRPNALKSFRAHACELSQSSW